MARAIVLNAKLRRTGICGAAETLLLDRACVATHLAPIITDLLQAGCEVRGDETVQKVDERVRAASEEDWYTEYLDSIIAVRVVADVDAAIAHIARYGSAHTEAIVTANASRPRASCSRWTAPSCCTTLPRNSRRRRIRDGRGDRHLHRSLPRQRSGGRGAADQLQVRGARRRAAAAVAGVGWR